MPIFDIEAPGGKILSIEAPDEQQALAGAQSWHAQQQQPAPAARPEYDGGGGIAPAVSAGARGFNKALTDVVGMPGNLMDMAAVPLAKKLGLVGQDREHIFGGADATARRGLDAAAHAAGLNPDAKMAYESRNELPADTRWAGAAGEAVGSAVPFAAGLGAASLGADLAATAPASVGKDLVRHIAKNPTSYAATELGAAAGGAQGAAIGQVLDNEGDTGAALGGLVGSIVNPAGTLVNASKGIKNAGTGVASLFSKGAAEDRAAAHLSKLINEGGEDVSAIARNIDTGAADPLAAPFNAADRSNSPTLLGLQSRIAADSPDFGKALAAQREQGFTNLRTTAMDELGGDPAALTRTAEGVKARADSARQTFADNAAAHRDTTVGAVEGDLKAFTDRATRQAENTAVPFTRDAEVRNNASGAARGALDEAYEADKAAERNLWQQLDLSQKVVPTNFRKAIGEAERALLPGESLPGPIAEIARIAKTRKGMQSFTAEGVQNVRSRILTLKRAEDAGSGDGVWGHVYGKLADGLLDDLAQVPGSAEARAFTRDLHDRWTRTVAGDTQRVTGSGADKVGEMSTLSRAMSGTDAERAGKFAALRTAAGERGQAVQDAQEAFLRQHAAERITDPQTGAVKPAAAAKYAADNATLLSPFPGLRQQLEDAGRTAQAVRTAVPEAQAAAKGAVKGAEDQFGRQIKDANRTAQILADHSAFGKVLKAGERPEKAVTGALTGSNPTRDLRGLAALAKGGGEDAVAGLRSATLDHTFAQAGKQARQAGGFWHSVGEQLSSPLATGKPSLMDSLTGNRVLTATGKVRLEQIVNRGKAIEAADATGRHIKEAGPATDLFVDQIIRTAGANYGAGISVFGHSGASMSAAGYGSRVFRKLFEDMPSQKAVDVLQKALGDDALMKKLLSKHTPAKEPGVIEAIKRELGDVMSRRKSIAAGVKGAATAANSARPPLRIRVTPRSATLGATMGLLN
jgi:hypothetical protein